MTKANKTTGSFDPESLCYLITVSQSHIVPAQMLINTLRRKTNKPIVAVGNLDDSQKPLIIAQGVTYIDEDKIDYSGRLPKVDWQTKHREFGWYKQQFIRLCIDRFINTDFVVILDSEVFVFDNWDENRFFDATSGRPRCGYWIAEKRKSDWDYMMYKGAAYLLSFLTGCKGIMEYSESNDIKRSITGVGFFSTKNIAELWRTLEKNTDLNKNLNDLFNSQPDLMFSEYMFYSLAAEYGLFDNTVPTVLQTGLLGWYDSHQDQNFELFKANAMWSMCQEHKSYSSTQEYVDFMSDTAKKLKQTIPPQQPYWNKADRQLIDNKYGDKNDIEYFKKYKKQLNYTFRRRFNTMYKALELCLQIAPKGPVILEVGTLRDNTMGGGHSTYKFGEFCSMFNGTLHTVDISDEAIEFSMKATSDFQPWIKYHNSDSTHFLKDFTGEINLLYLDGFDSTDGKEEAASQKQLEEIQAALPRLSERCVVLLDDADLPKGGKVALSSKYLVKHGFKPVLKEYQYLYVRNRLPTRQRITNRISRKLVKSPKF